MAALSDCEIRRVRTSDARAIAALYRPYVDASRITFEVDPPTTQDMAAWVAKVDGRYPWLVAQAADGAIVGYAYASAFRERPAYRFAVETSIYLDPDFMGHGLGMRLYSPLLDILTEQHFIHAIGAITLPNAASVALHQRLGFVEVGSYPDIGFKLGEWATVGLFQKALCQTPEQPGEPLPLAHSPTWATMPA